MGGRTSPFLASSVNELLTKVGFPRPTLVWGFRTADPVPVPAGGI